MTYMTYVRQETAAYRLESDRFGFFILTRKSDGKSAFFQGDDADLWSRNMAAIEHCFGYDKADYDEELANQIFDCLCSGYDDILEDA